MSLKHKILNTIPTSCRQRLRKAYYPWMLRHFDESRWPLSHWVKSLINEGDVVVDVGANIGYVSMLLSRYVGAAGCVYSMEPVPETYSYLAHNIQKLGLHNVTSYNVALSSEPGSLFMEIPDYDDGGANFYEAHLLANDDGPNGSKQDLRRIEVNVATLDELLKECGSRISFIKIDVEGHEWNVIQGARRLIQASQPSLLIEVQGNPDTSDTDAGKLFRWLLQQGYGVYCPVDGKLTPRLAGYIAGDYFFVHHAGKGRVDCLVR